MSRLTELHDTLRDHPIEVGENVNLLSQDEWKLLLQGLTWLTLFATPEWKQQAEQLSAKIKEHYYNV